MHLRVLVVVVVCGCIHSGETICSDGLVCPAGTTCRELTNPAEEVCATPEQLTACDGAAPLAPCMTGGRCYDGVCEPAGCGNGRTDPEEVCDDGNAIVGDGCSNACLSNETCGNGIVDPLHIVGTVSEPNEQCDDANGVSHDGCASDCQNETPTWEPIAIGPPSGRAGARAVYDTARRRVVLFGGDSLFGNLGGPGLSDTWEWDGIGWHGVITFVTPIARFGEALAYDAARRRVVMFGGSTAFTNTVVSSNINDTWEYDGSQWTAISPAHRPAARYDMGSAYDGKHHVVVVFGGTADDGSALGDTWEYNGSDWKQIAGTSPPARKSAAMAFDPKRGVIVMAGSGATDTWEYDGAWHDVTPASAAGKSDLVTRFQLSYEPISQTVIGYGGINAAGTGFNPNTWTWNGTAWTKVATSGIGARAWTTLVADLAHGKTLAFGGYNVISCGLLGCFQSFSDTYTWTGAAWSLMTVPLAPAARVLPMVSLDTRRSKLLVFGGQIFNNGLRPDNTTWEFDGGHWTQFFPPSPPSVRSLAAIAYDAAHSRTILFGGADINGLPLGDMYAWDGAQWSTVTPAKLPTARFGTATVYDPVRGRIVLFGGLDSGATPLGDTWEWDGTTWTQVATIGPLARFDPVATWDPLHRRVVISGGRNGGGVLLRDTWDWDGTTWTQADINALDTPSGRLSSGMAWNPARGRVELFGGRQAGIGSPATETWEWDHTSWTYQTPAQSPSPPREGHGMASSLAGDGVLLFGGEDTTTVPTYTVYNDLWQLRWTSRDRFEACSISDLDSDGDGLAGCADPDCWARCSPFCPPGSMCEPSWPRCGDGICTALEDCRLCPQDCSTCTVVCGDGFCDAGETAQACPGDCP